MRLAAGGRVRAKVCKGLHAHSMKFGLFFSGKETERLFTVLALSCPGWQDLDVGSWPAD